MPIHFFKKTTNSKIFTTIAPSSTVQMSVDEELEEEHHLCIVEKNFVIYAGLSIIIFMLIILVMGIIIFKLKKKTKI
jgi:hypothetical protein